MSRRLSEGATRGGPNWEEVLLQAMIPSGRTPKPVSKEFQVALHWTHDDHAIRADGPRCATHRKLIESCILYNLDDSNVEFKQASSNPTVGEIDG